MYAICQRKGDAVAKTIEEIGYQPESSISGCVGSGVTPSSTRAIVVSLKNAVNHAVTLTTPSDCVVRRRSIGRRRWLWQRLHALYPPPTLRTTSSPDNPGDK